MHAQIFKNHVNNLCFRKKTALERVEGKCATRTSEGKTVQWRRVALEKQWAGKKLYSPLSFLNQIPDLHFANINKRPNTNKNQFLREDRHR